jgi:hypothetical protein
VLSLTAPLRRRLAVPSSANSKMAVRSDLLACCLWTRPVLEWGAQIVWTAGELRRVLRMQLRGPGMGAVGPRAGCQQAPGDAQRVIDDREAGHRPRETRGSGLL